MTSLIVDLVLTNVKAYQEKEIIECCISIENGEIMKIGKETNMPNADEHINLRNLLVLPGLIDCHVHLRDEGKAYKEDFFSGTAAAAAGGITTVLDMPNNEPVTMSTETIKNRMRTAEKKILVNVGFYSEFPRKLEEIKEIADQGAFAFKLFMGSQVGGVNINDDVALERAFAKAGEEHIPVAVHAEDKTMISTKEQELKRSKHEDAKAFLKAHTEKAELKAIERILKLTTQTSNRVHFCHITIKEGMDRISEAKEAGQKVTCEVTPHHLLLSGADFEERGSLLAVMPPLRDNINIEALWKGVSDGLIDVLGSDHAPHTLAEKSTDSIWDVKVGFPGLETTLPLLLTMIRKNRLSLETLIGLLSERPAKIFNLKGKGTLKQGSKADLVAIDFNKRFRINASRFYSKAKFSPYDGWEVQGKPTKTFVNGKLVMDEGEIVAKGGSGEILRRNYT
ncbi:MAG TPA: dihydroorotase family protein [Candidatus Bathyarchaeia archaeon]